MLFLPLLPARRDRHQIKSKSAGLTVSKPFLFARRNIHIFFDAIDRLFSSAGRTVKVNCPLKFQIARYEPLNELR